MTETKKENEREIVLAILIEVLEKNQFSNIVIRQALDKYSYLPQKDRSFIARLSRGCVERKIELDAIIDKAASVKASKQKPVIRNILRMAAYQLKYMDVPEHAVCSEAVKLAAKKGFWSLKGFVNAVTRKMAVLIPTLDWSDQPSVYYSVPQWLYDKLLSWYPKEKVAAYLEAVVSQSGHPMYVHCHTGRYSIEEIVSSLEKEGISVTKAPYADDCLELTDAGDIRRTKVFQDGLIQIQDISSALAAQCVAPQENSFCIDMCAAPGGKATELGAKLNGSGVLIANDLSNSRARGLLKNIELFGIGNVLVLSEEPGKLVNYFPEYFDKILIDAPCSGEGMFRKDRKMVKAWEEHGPEFFVKIQRSIITQAAQMLKPGGMLLYSTCTFSPEENEQTIEFLLQEYPQFKICDIKGYEGFSDGILKASLSGNEQLKKTIRIFPHKMEGEGHFIALLKKEEEAVSENLKEKEKNNRNKNEKEKRLPDELTEFLKNVKRKFDSSRIDMRGENVYYMPEGLPKLNGVRFLRSGLLLGELKKRRFEPSQALAMNLKKEEYENVLDFSVDDERIIKYLKGETLEVEDLVSSKEKGWYLVCVDGYPLGFGKLSGQMLKNKYLPGWRWQSS